jgi:hypothetical protein
MKKLIEGAIAKPKIIMTLSLIAVVLALVQFPKILVDTDPENMLPYDAPVRVFHRDMKKEFGLYDMIVIGIVNPQHEYGVYNPATLENIYQITEEIKKVEGVISHEIMAPSTRDNIQQAGIGTVRFNWLMDKPPETQEEALKIRDEAQDHPMFRGTVVSDNGMAMAIYVPIEKKDLSYEVSQEIKSIVDQHKEEEEYHFTGLPIANDQFGVEMFKQMAISAPLAGLVIFLLMWFFFRSLQLIIAPMLLAMTTVITTMGLLIGFGFPVHIMSSMIPIFLMPIAVLDSIHILSEFFDKYPEYQDRKKTIRFVIDELFRPMLFTSLTSAAGFFSLSFSPIPPVQVFGVFVATGILIAWVLTMLFIPAYIMLMNVKRFDNFGHALNEEKASKVDRVLDLIKKGALHHHKLVITATVLLVIISVYGISLIQVNDNPVRWFEKDHPIRVADRILNENFAGTYEAYLVLEAEDKSGEPFMQPEMLRYVEKLQQSMKESGLVGKSMSLADITKKIYYELLGGDKANNVIPDSKAAVAQSLISFENSHRPDDLWKITTPDYTKLNIWVQLSSGDNKDMAQVVKHVNQFFNNNSPPQEITHNWAGLTYINVVWQNNMVVGMLKNFMGSFIIVLFMMLFLFRSPTRALLSMIPLTVTIVFIYSLLGFVGKDYDMPVAVLSALTLGLSVDFAIHFIQRSIEINRDKGSWPKTAAEMFQGPGRAIMRNALVVAIGFLPLLAAPLVPYKTVGFFMFAIMAVSSVATLLIIPAFISLFPELVAQKTEGKTTCKCWHCILVALFVAAAVAYVLKGYTLVTWTPITFISIFIIVVFAVLCHFASQRKKCLNEGGQS